MRLKIDNYLVAKRYKIVNRKFLLMKNRKYKILFDDLVIIRLQDQSDDCVFTFTSSCIPRLNLFDYFYTDQELRDNKLDSILN